MKERFCTIFDVRVSDMNTNRPPPLDSLLMLYIIYPGILNRTSSPSVIQVSHRAIIETVIFIDLSKSKSRLKLVLIPLIFRNNKEIVSFTIISRFFTSFISLFGWIAADSSTSSSKSSRVSLILRM